MKRARIHPENVSLLPDGKGWLLVEFGGDTKAESDAKATAAMTALPKRPHAPTMKLYDNPAAEERLWKVQESGTRRHGARAGRARHLGRVGGLGQYVWIASATSFETCADCSTSTTTSARYTGTSGKVASTPESTSISNRLPASRNTERSWMTRVRSWSRTGGSLSGEHGDGQSKAEFLPKMFGPELVDAFREFKRLLLDPDGLMNPAADRRSIPHRSEFAPGC